LRALHQLWEFEDFLKFERRLYAKHRKHYKHIHTWLGEISWLSLRWRALKGFLGPLYVRLFPDSKLTLRRELSGCGSVLDLGCGHFSPVGGCNIPFTVGVELFEPYLQESRRKRIHSQYVTADVRRIEFKPKSFDAVLAIDLLQHLTKEEGTKLLSKMEKWAREKVVVLTTNGYVWQDAYDENPLQEHKSGWSVDELRDLGFRVYGINGWKKLRGHRSSTKYQPAFLWERISALTQKITYRYPKLAFKLIAIKQVEHGT
jgi:SAM-dependent methyltransferase